MATIHLILLLPSSLKIKIIMRYTFSPTRFTEYQNINSVVDINSIEVNSVKPIKMGNVHILGPSNSTYRHLLKKTVIQV